MPTVKDWRKAPLGFIFKVTRREKEREVNFFGGINFD